MPRWGATPEEQAASRARRVKRWYNSLPVEQRPTEETAKQAIADLCSKGLCDAQGNLTDAGELYYLQLQQLEWMVKNPPEVRKAKRAKQKS